MHELLQALVATGSPVLTDGAWGTALQARGLERGACPEALNTDAPDMVQAVAAAYASAGSRVVLSNSFGGNRFRLAEYGREGQVRELNRRAAELSKLGAEDKAKVFASIGPSGKMLMMGAVTEDELTEAFKEQAQALAEGGADGIVIETMSDLEECKLAAAAALTTGLPVIACLTYDTGPEMDRTMMGTTPEQAAEELGALGVHGVGANCGQGIETYAKVCARLTATAGDLAVWIKANAGVPQVQGGEVVYPTEPAAFAACVPDLKAAGATFVGGCCGTTPEHIRAVAEAIG